MAEQKFLDQEGVKYLWSKISMEDYPNNDTLVAVLNAIDETKQDKIIGKGLSTNDYTTEEKNKLAAIQEGAEANVQADWNVTDETSDAFIKNKPVPDSTLTIEGAAADAKIVGDALAGKQPAGDYALKSDVASITVPNSNLVNGSAEGSLRTVSSAEESDTYTLGDCAIALGRNSKASGSNSYAEGWYATARGNRSHAEGYRTSALGTSSHAEGYYTTASGDDSHAEGCDTQALGDYSHAGGYYTTADHLGMTVIGKCNKTSTLDEYGLTSDFVTQAIYTSQSYTMSTVAPTPSYTNGTFTWENTVVKMGSGLAVGDYIKINNNDTSYWQLKSMTQNTGSMRLWTVAKYELVGKSKRPGNYVFVIGNGDREEERSNAHALDWNGNAYYAGDVYVTGDGKNDFAGSKKLATEDFVTAALTALGLPVPTAADAGKILRVNAQGKYELVALANAEEATF